MQGYTLGFARPPVSGGPELQRILAINRRPPPDLSGLRGEALVELMTSRLSRDNPRCKCASMGRPCIRRLLPVQAWALYEIPLAGGLLGPIGVGHGKTLLDILAAVVFEHTSRPCKLAVLLIPPGLREQIIREYLVLAEHFRVPSLVLEGKGFVVPGAPVVHVIPYSKFSRGESTVLLDRLRPDLVIADEAHKLRHRGTATTSRVLRWWAERPDTRLCAWSGTLTSKSVKDYGHLSAFALREASPLPIDPNALEEWSTALDPSDWPAPPGALTALGEPLQRGFHRRLVETLGVVATKEGSVDASLNILEYKPPSLPEKVKTLLRALREAWVRPDGEELVDILSVARSARELACGFYYCWVFPFGEPSWLIDDWYEARKLWHRELRGRLVHPEAHLDSPLLCAKAAIRAWQKPAYEGDLPRWKAEAWPRWRDIRDKVKPETKAVWVDDWLVRNAADWARERKGIVWYEHDAFGRHLSEVSGLPRHGGGLNAGECIAAEKGNRSIICSIKAHGTGRDGLQRLFACQLVANPPSSGAVWEQLLGRLHRIGQAADEVETWVYRHTKEFADAIDTAIRQAKYIEGTLGILQKLRAASFNWDLPNAGGTTNLPLHPKN